MNITSSPRITVAIPTRNRADMLRGCIQSVLDQTFSDFEVVVSDNASTDNTAEVVASFEDPRIHYSPLESNIGLWGNLSRCFSLGTAPYVCILPDDDYMLPRNLERKVESLDRNPEAGMVHSAFQLLMVHPDQTEELQENVDHVHGSVDRIDPGDAVIRHLLTESYFLNFSGAALRRSVVRDEHFDAREGAAADLGVCLRIARKAAVAFLTEPLVVYRLHPGAGSVQDGVWEFETGTYRPTLASIAETKRPKEIFLATYGREMTDLREVRSASRRYALKALLYVLKLKSDPTRSRRERFRVLWDAVRIDPSILLQRPAIRYLASTVLGPRGLKLARHVATPDRKDRDPSRDTPVR
jgi:glycosyltransferase involved in cell wall biosynthesis